MISANNPPQGGEHNCHSLKCEWCLGTSFQRVWYGEGGKRQLFGTVLGSDVLNIIPKAQVTKAKIDK